MAFLVLRTLAHLRHERRVFERLQRLPQGFSRLPKLPGDDVQVSDDALRRGLGQPITDFRRDRERPVGRGPCWAIAHQRPEAYRPMTRDGGLTLAILEDHGEVFGTAHVRVRTL